LKRYLSFDIETARELPDGIKDILQHRPLGIACATAVAEDDTANSFRWHGWDENQQPASQMSLWPKITLTCSSIFSARVVSP
jgi:hypothetical protein